MSLGCWVTRDATWPTFSGLRAMQALVSWSPIRALLA